MAAKKKRVHFPNIVRIDTKTPKSRHGWEVKIVRVAGDSFYRSFPDSAYAGRGQALAAAIKCRDKELKKRPVLSTFERAMRPRKTNRSGIVGVRKTIRKVTRGKKTWSYPVWAVTGTPVSGGKSHTKYFAIGVRGERGAKAKAVAQRREWEEALRASVAGKAKTRARG